MPKYELCEQGYTFDTVEADSADEALDSFDPESGDYGDGRKTTWTHIYAFNVDGSNDSDSRRFEIEPTEPDCSGESHDWRSPIEIVGGIKENPGVWGHGGGVIITECCMHCGCKRVTDTWAQDPENGEQGLTSVEYEPGAFASELEALREANKS